MESRKRIRTEEGDGIPAKKRAMTGERDSPVHVNGTASDAEVPQEDANLEAFRKDAIYRRMKHYSRENDRSQARIAELTRRRDTCEAGLAAFQACWSQLLETIQSLSNAEDLPKVDVSPEELLHLSAQVVSDPDASYSETLQNKMHATQQLVTAFMQSGGRTSAPLLHDEMFSRCRTAQTESLSLHSEVALVRSKLQSVESEKEDLHEKLILAEQRLDRLKSKTIAALQPESPSSTEDKAKEEVKDEKPRDSPASPAHPSNGSLGYLLDSDDTPWKELAMFRERKMGDFVNTINRVRDENWSLVANNAGPPQEVIERNPYFQGLLDRNRRLEYTLNSTRLEVERLDNELNQITAVRQQWLVELTADSEKTIQELKAALEKRDGELLRLRQQRDQYYAEMIERRAKDEVVLRSTEELEALTNSRSDRISVLQIENKRLKTRLAAEANEEDLMNFLFREGNHERTYVDDLHERLHAAETRAEQLANSLSFFQEDHPDVMQHIRAEAEAKEKLAAATEKLAKFEAIFGEALSNLPPDIQSLGRELESKNREIQSLRLQLQQREQTEQSLYSELDSLSASWETLDKQIKSKILDLASMETRLKQAQVDKAKAENKYHSVTRAKDAAEAERKVLTRTDEMQRRVIEKLTLSEQSFSQRLMGIEKDSVARAREKEFFMKRIQQLEGDLVAQSGRADAERLKAQEYPTKLAEYLKRTQAKERELYLQEEALVKVRKQAETEIAKAQAIEKAHSGNSSSREAQLQSELDKCMTLLQCSTCKMNMRNTVITKCMHSFCKACVESRISTRQRKCPACNLGFSQGEVQPLYLQ